MALVSLLMNLLRLALATLLLALCLADWPALSARAEFAALPEHDLRAEAQRLRAQARYSEALLALDAAAPDDAERAQLRQQIETERDRWQRRLAEAGRGALTGEGHSVEALAGAVTADLFVFGDVRDLVIQGSRALRGEPTDEVIVALSAAGLVLTVTPALDLGGALLKFARRMGALGESLARRLTRLARRAVDTGDTAPLKAVLADTAKLSEHARPAATLAILKQVDDVNDLRRTARFAEQPGGAYALWRGGKPALAWLKHSGRAGDELLLRAARKGPTGLAYLQRQGALLLRPHPLLGLLKGLYKGNVPALLSRLLTDFSAAVAGLLAGWFFYELCRLVIRLWQRAARAARRPVVPALPPASPRASHPS